MISTVSTWLAGKALSAFGERVGRVLGNPVVIEVLIVVAVLGGSYWLGSHNGRVACETAHKDEIIQTQAGVISDTAGALVAARDGAAKLAGDLKGLRAGAEQARKDLRDALPPPTLDHACDLPGGPTRRLLNRSSGYPE